MAALASDALDRGALVAEGAPKSLVLCFKASKLPMGSLRLIPQEAWSSMMQGIGRSIRSRVDSTPVERGLSHAGPEKKSRKVSTKGLTSYLLSDASLSLSDTTVTLNTRGGAPPLAAMESILDHAVPAWREKKCPENYLKFITFTSTGSGAQQRKSWAEEVEYLEKYFYCGEDMVLGGSTGENHYIFVANYLNKDEISGVFSTRVSLRGLDPTESAKRFAGKSGLAEGDQAGPLRLAWASIHGEEARSIATNVQMQESFQADGYAANGVFSQHVTATHACVKPHGSYVSVETTLPLTKQAKARFILGVESMCDATEVTFTEFVLSPTLFLGGPPPEIPNFSLCRSSESIGKNFACAVHHYTRVPAGTRAARCPPLMSSPEPLAAAAEAISELPSVVLVEDIAEAPVKAAELFIQSVEACAGAGSKDLPVALLDLAQLERQAEYWRRLLPRVEPFYAVKCNGFLPLVQTLLDVWREWGAGGFDCASIAEMKLITGLQVDPRRQIVFANPCKQPSSVEFAKAAGVSRIVFDNAAELDKIKRLHPQAELLLRVQTDDTLARCPLSNKFGAAVEECGKLLERAQQLELQVVGVSFHVGSGCSQLGAFRSALRRARAAFDEASRLGLSFSVLDIGGGFPGFDEDGCATFADHAADISSVLEELFPSPDIQVIAEPGRFFVSSAQALLTSVISVAESSQGFRYYLNDGLYGSFNSVVYDHARVPEPVILRGGKELLSSAAGPLCACTIFGPTCDGFDMITDSMPLPMLQAGDHLLFKCMGAYTSAASTSFNGFAPAAPVAYRSRAES